MRHGKERIFKRNNHNFTISDFTCSVCGYHVPLPRSMSLQRQKGHLKCLWCPRCKGKQNFIEKREFDF